MKLAVRLTVCTLMGLEPVTPDLQTSIITVAPLIAVSKLIIRPYLSMLSSSTNWSLVLEIRQNFPISFIVYLLMELVIPRFPLSYWLKLAYQCRMKIFSNFVFVSILSLLINFPTFSSFDNEKTSFLRI